VVAFLRSASLSHFWKEWFCGNVISMVFGAAFFCVHSQGLKPAKASFFTSRLVFASSNLMLFPLKSISFCKASGSSFGFSQRVCCYFPYHQFTMPWHCK
jgi:hypothetical protein